MKPKDKDVIRWALLDAIKWVESLADSYSTANGSEAACIRAKCEHKINSFRDLLSRRYGGIPADPFADAKSISIYEISKNSR